MTADVRDAEHLPPSMQRLRARRAEVVPAWPSCEICGCNALIPLQGNPQKYECRVCRHTGYVRDLENYLLWQTTVTSILSERRAKAESLHKFTPIDGEGYNEIMYACTCGDRFPTKSQVKKHVRNLVVSAPSDDEIMDRLANSPNPKQAIELLRKLQLKERADYRFTRGIKIAYKDNVGSLNAFRKTLLLLSFVPCLSRIYVLTDRETEVGEYSNQEKAFVSKDQANKDLVEFVNIEPVPSNRNIRLKLEQTIEKILSGEFYKVPPIRKGMPRWYRSPDRISPKDSAWGKSKKRYNRYGRQGFKKGSKVR